MTHLFPIGIRRFGRKIMYILLMTVLFVVTSSVSLAGLGMLVLSDSWWAITIPLACWYIWLMLKGEIYRSFGGKIYF